MAGEPFLQPKSFDFLFFSVISFLLHFRKRSRSFLKRKRKGERKRGDASHLVAYQCDRMDDIMRACIPRT